MTDTVGQFLEMKANEDAESLVLSFRPGSVPIKQRWRNNGLSADFLGDYVTTFFPQIEDNPTTITHQAEIRSAVTYIANELLENAMKYADEQFSSPVTISLYMADDLLSFSESNAMSHAQGEVFRRHILWLNSGDPSELYMEALENSATREDGGSGLGLITMMNDYGAKLAWKFEKLGYDAVMITTQVTISV